MTTGHIGGPCQDRSGFLFNHACSRIATGVCQSCNRAICAEHTARSGELMVCATCKKKGLQQSQTQPDTETRDPRVRREILRQEREPYYYGYGRYHGWGYYGSGYWGHSHRHYDSSHHDSSDFTEADAESLSVEGEEGWETDMGAS